MYKYRAYGLNISSEIFIPELLEREGGDEDVLIRYGCVNRPDFHGDTHYIIEQPSPDQYVYYINDIGGIRVEGKDKIIVSPLDGSEERGFRFLVSGIALGILLHKRGFMALHASAVVLQNHAIGFAGAKGMGKSTTAAAFHARDYSVITDDLLILKPADDGVTAYPGFPHLKLYPQSIRESFREDPGQIPKIDPLGTKRSYKANTGFLGRPLPLRCLYVLDYKDPESGNNSPCSEILKGRRACIEMIRHSYVPRLLPKEAVSSEYLAQCEEIVKRVPLRRLCRKKSLEQLSEIVSLVEEEQKVDDQVIYA